MKRSAVETMMGAVVLAVAGMFVAFAYSSAAVRTGDGYDLVAKFEKIDGIRDGGDVRISGIKVGTVLSTVLDPKTFQAVVRIKIDKSVELPVDTVASITSSGLLGDKFVQLAPGGDDKIIPPGGTIKFTQASVNLESLLGQAVFSAQNTAKTPAPDAPAKP